MELKGDTWRGVFRQWAPQRPPKTPNTSQDPSKTLKCNKKLVFRTQNIKKTTPKDVYFDKNLMPYPNPNPSPNPNPNPNSGSNPYSNSNPNSNPNFNPKSKSESQSRSKFQIPIPILNQQTYQTHHTHQNFKMPRCRNAETPIPARRNARSD